MTSNHTLYLIFAAAHSRPRKECRSHSALPPRERLGAGRSSAAHNLHLAFCRATAQSTSISGLSRIVENLQKKQETKTRNPQHYGSTRRSLVAQYFVVCRKCQGLFELRKKLQDAAQRLAGRCRLGFLCRVPPRALRRTSVQEEARVGSSCLNLETNPLLAV